MAPDTHTPPPGSAASPDDGATTDRCPQCRGLVRPDAPWCTQCWTDLRPAPPEPRAAEPTPEPSPEPTAGPTAPAVLAPPSADAAVGEARVVRGLGGWPCTVCQAVNAIELDACTECGSGFLAGVRDADPALVVPGLGDITKVSRAQRLAVAGGIALLFMALVAVIGLLGS